MIMDKNGPARFQKYLSSTKPDHIKPDVVSILAAIDHLEKSSPEIASSIIQELKDQRAYLKLIASENYSSLAVQLAMGNWLTDKYAEGYPFHRFYAGCANVDAIEALACDRLKELFGAEAAYVQPHSGADANLVAFWAILVQRIQNNELEKLGKKSLDELDPSQYESIRQQLVNQKLLALSLNSGGHLTHGYRHNLSSKILKASHYDVDPKTELLNYDEIRKKAQEDKPLILLAGYSAYPRKIDFSKMKEIADEVGATFMVDMAHFAGLVAGKAFTGVFNPIPYADVVTSTTHKTLRGPRGGIILCKKTFEESINKGCPLALGGPLPHVMAAKAIAFKEANSPEFSAYAHKIIENSQALAAALMKEEVRVVTGGTDNHLLIFDTRPFGLTGRQAELALREAHITSNRNAIPFDPNGPWYTSGIRIGTPALTTLGMGASEMQEIAKIIVSTLRNTRAKTTSSGNTKSQAETDPAITLRSQQAVKDLLAKFPLYPELPL
jgi:glycine hydroxymethyltransferase